MWHLLVWLPMALFIGLWTLLCGAVHGLLAAAGPALADPAAWLAALEQWRIPLWLTAWLPMALLTELKAWVTGVMAAWGPWLGALWAHAPALLGWLAPLVWLAWGLGTLLLLGCGLAGSVLVAALRRARPAAPARRAPG